VAYDNNQVRHLGIVAWKGSRRSAVALFTSILLARSPQDPTSQTGDFPNDRRPKEPNPNEDPRLPDGRSQKNAIAKQQHEDALKDAERLVEAAQDLRDELQRAGTFVVPLGSVKKTEEIEKLAKRIRGRLKS
jgi:Zn-dependent oligopeptidase